ncbi:MAG: DNA-processing protein DprA [Bacteroidales bacterium]|nr:DNA-processing protein DprA [Bacteroidales bacterium]
METSLLYQIALTLIPGIGDVNGKKLIHYCGSAEAVFASSKKELMAIPGIGTATVNSILNQNVLHRAEEEINFMEQNNITALYYEDPDFPQRLLNCYDHPLMLYYKGKANLNHRRIVAVVGTRKASSYGRRYCNELIEGLKESNILVVSGLAYGIDSCAHQISVDLDIPTVGVLGHGLDLIYPDQNKKLAMEMSNNGGLLTEFLSKTKPDREHFPQRNRIVSGMCDALIVVESGVKGGAMITAELANSYNRDVFAVPGRLNDHFSKGCNNLIKTNRAVLVQTADDISYIMGWENKVQPKQTQLFSELNEEELLLIELIKQSGGLGLDLIMMKSGMQPSVVAGTLLNLELKGRLQVLPGKQYKVLD